MLRIVAWNSAAVGLVALLAGCSGSGDCSEESSGDERSVLVPVADFRVGEPVHGAGKTGGVVIIVNLLVFAWPPNSSYAACSIKNHEGNAIALPAGLIAGMLREASYVTPGGRSLRMDCHSVTVHGSNLEIAVPANTTIELEVGLTACSTFEYDADALAPIKIARIDYSWEFALMRGKRVRIEVQGEPIVQRR